MTKARAQQIVDTWSRIERINSYLSMADKEESPHRKFTVLMGNLSHEIPAHFVDSVYKDWSSYLKSKTDTQEGDLKRINE